MSELEHKDAHGLALPIRQITRARTWTGDIEWYTPPDILAAAVEVLGGIDIDPASSDAQQSAAPVKASTYFTVENSKLDQSWRGRVWLNPPYARGWIDLFATKMVEFLSVRRNVRRHHAHE